MQFRNHVRILAMGSMLALAVLSLPAVHAHAEARQGAGDYGSCINPSDGQTYYPGERVFSTDGRVMECQFDGSWKPVSLLVASPSSHLPVAPIRATGVVVP